MSLMTRSPLIYNVHNKLQLLRPLRRGYTCLETSFSATFCEPGKPLSITIYLIHNLQNRNFSYACRYFVPHISCAARSNLLPPLHFARNIIPFKLCLRVVRERFVHNKACVPYKLSAGENALFGWYVEFHALFWSNCYAYTILDAPQDWHFNAPALY